MITKNTLFVVGAGASCEYGFPSGKSLIAEIIGNLNEGVAKNNANKTINFTMALKNNLIYKAFCTSEDPDTFLLSHSNLFSIARKLLYSGTTSIDDFLALNNDEVVTLILKTLLYYKISQNESIEHLVKLDVDKAEEKNEYTIKEGWLSPLWKAMYQGCSTIDDLVSQNNISLLTFNYDRTIEAFLLEAAFNLFSDHTTFLQRSALDRVNIKKKLSNFPVGHAYGSLGDYFSNKHSDYRAKSLKECYKSSNTIRTYGETKSDSFNIFHRNSTEKLNSVIKNLDQIIFLGFGYLDQNISLLNTFLSENSSFPIDKSIFIGGTSKGFHKNRVDTQITSKLKHKLNGNFSIRNHHFVDCSANEYISNYFNPN